MSGRELLEFLATLPTGRAATPLRATLGDSTTMKATPLCIALLSVVEPSLTLSAARGWLRTGARRTHPRMAGFVTPRSELTPKPQTVTLTGCMDGVGVGLDVDNCVDMLTPCKPAAAVLHLTEVPPRLQAPRPPLAKPRRALRYCCSDEQWQAALSVVTFRQRAPPTSCAC